MSPSQFEALVQLSPNEAWNELKRKFEWSKEETYSFVFNSIQALSISKDIQVLEFVKSHEQILSRASFEGYPLVKRTNDKMTEEEKLEVNHINLVYSSFILRGLPRNWRWKAFESTFRKDPAKDWHPSTLLLRIRLFLRDVVMVKN